MSVNDGRKLTPLRRAGSTSRRNTLLCGGCGDGTTRTERQLGVEDEYWRLTLSGVGTSKRVGSWDRPQDGISLAGRRGGLPPVRLAEGVRGTRYLSRFERQRIGSLRAGGMGVREIARRLERSPATVSRELRRNV